MLNHYLLLAVKVLLRRKFFTFISLFGISFTLLVLTVVTALFDHSFGPGAPETRQDRTLYVERAVMYGPHNTVVEQRRLQAARQVRAQPAGRRTAVALSKANGTVHSYIDGRKIASSLKRTDDEFWRILDFTFLEGGPYGTADVAEARFVAVINATTRERFFGGRPAVGQTLEADGQRFRVVGVVEDVSELRTAPYAEIWVPYTTAKTDAYKTRDHGRLERHGARDETRRRWPRIHEEFNSRLLRVELPDPKEFQAIVAPFETKFEAFARLMPTGDRKDPESQVWRLVGLLTALGAAVRADSHREPRQHQHQPHHGAGVGDRRAQGVRRAGADAGRAVPRREHPADARRRPRSDSSLSILALRAISQSGMFRYAHFTLNPRVFAYGMALAVVFGLDLRRLPGVADVAAQPGRRAEGRRVPMTRHLLRLIWNRKRQNFLLTLEIFFSFLTLFGVVLFAVHFANNSRQPLGFDIDRVWSITVDRKEADEDPGGQGAPSRNLSPAAAGAARDAAGRDRRRRRSPVPMPTPTGAAACAWPAAARSTTG